MKTVNANTEVVDSIPATSPSNNGQQFNTVPSIINIPPQISTTLVWVAVGFAIGVWVMWNRKS